MTLIERWLAPALLLAACSPLGYTEDLPSYLDDPSYSRAVLRTDLTSTDNTYASERLDNVGRAWFDLPTRDPASVPVTAEHLLAAQAGQPLPFDDSRATDLTPAALPSTQDDWIALGRRVFYEYPLRAEPALHRVLAEPDGPQTYGFLLEDNAFIGIRAFVQDGEVVVGPTCAQCHVGLGPDGHSTGQLSNRDMGVGAIRLLSLDIPHDTPISELDSTLEKDLHRLGPGRADVLGDGRFNPFAFPDLGGLVDVPYLQHNANWTHRTQSTLALRCETLFITSASRQHRIPRELSWAVAAWIRSLPPPPAEPPTDRTERGAEVFQAEGCPACHTPPLYTSDRLVTLAEVGTEPDAGESPARGTGHYRIPSLRGVAHTAPYLHHGAVPSLHAFFDPEREEPGHPFGQGLSQEDREALVAFLRSI